MAARHQPHRVRSVTLDIRFANEETAARSRLALQREFHAAIEPGLSNAFDEFDDGRHRYIEALELDLGRITLGNISRDSIRRATTAGLARAVKPTDTNSDTPPAISETSRADHFLEPSVSLKMALSEFLKTGRWPWHTDIVTVADLETELARMSPDQEIEMAAALRVVLGQFVARARLAGQFSADGFAWCIRLLQRSAAGAMLAECEKIEAEYGPLTARTTTLTAAIEVELRGTENKTNIDRLVRVGLSEIRRRIGETNSQIPGEETPSDTADETLYSSNQQRIDEPELSECWYVQGAGIVLLHPFMPRFFDSCNLLDDRQQFRSHSAIRTAVHLLFYLVTGLDQPDEPDTTLYKLLCSFPNSIPLDKSLRIGSSLRDEADHLLESAITHWAKLGNTSPDGFRESFLQRAGRISRSANSLTLLVEPHSVDVLLAYLPWNVNVIRFPWMKSPIRVDWS